MPYLVVNGITVEVSAPQHGLQVDEGRGPIVRTVDGTATKDRRYFKPNHTFTTIPITKQDADALLLMLEGFGFNWNFEDATNFKFSTDANLASNGGSGTPASVVNAKYGSLAVRLDDTELITWPAAFPAVWTAMVWRDTGTGGYKHFAATSDGTFFLDGSPVSDEGFLGFAGGNFELRNNSGGGVDFDDLVIIPAVIRREWITQVGNSGAPFGKTPKLAIVGDPLIDAFSADAEALATNVRVSAAPYSDQFGGGWQIAAATVSFELLTV